jgi:biopolymer transport protein ExbD
MGGFGENQQESSSKYSISEINITPFVDVLLVLLIIFMVTAPFAMSGVNIELPKSAAKSLNVSGDPIILTVTRNGEFYLQKIKLREVELVNKLRAAKGSLSADKVVAYVRADTDVPYGKVMVAMAAMQNAGIKKIGMMGEKQN